MRRRAFRLPVREPVSQFAKRNEPARRFVPQHEANARKTLAQGEPADISEIGTLAKHQRQTIKRNSAAEMMDVMHADIGGEPAQHDGQIIMRAAVECGR